MSFIPSSPHHRHISHKRKFETIFCLAQITFLILCSVVHSNHAAVIKKRDTGITETKSGNIGLDTKEMAVVPTILTALNNASAAVTTKLQSVAGPNFATETSKELTNNEISINEAKRLSEGEFEEENKIKSGKNGTKSKTKTEVENFEYNSRATTISEDNLQDLKQKLQNLENKEQEGKVPETTKEFISNDIKQEQIPKLREKQPANSTANRDISNDNENSSSMENSLKIVDKNPRPPSKILTELRTATEKPTIKSKFLDKQLGNSIENSRKNEENLLVVDREERVTIKPFELSSSPTSNNEQKVTEISVNTFKIKERPAEVKFPETATSVTEVSENLQVLEISSVNPLKTSESKEYSTKRDSQEYQSNKIHNDLNPQELLNSVIGQNMVLTTTDSLLTLDETTLRPMTKEKDLLIFEGDKKEYARSLNMEETTTINFREVDEVLNPVTTYKPVKLSVKEGIEETTTQESFRELVKDLAPLRVKEKKPKFINDNSTNAQQLNLPNNAEVWSLASMKSLPKANVTIETAQTHNQTNKELKENLLHNTSWTMNNNSEKNLLDWSQIMMDKELSTTTRSEDYKRQEEDEAEKGNENEKLNHLTEIERKDNNTKELESATVSTTSTPEFERTQFKIQTMEDEITKNSLIEHELTTSTMPSITASTILSPLNYNENENDNEYNNRPDKKVEENMNNHLDTLTKTLATTVSTNVDNNPFNTSLNIEPNLNEINLTSNQTQVDLNNDAHTITTKSVDDDVNANGYIKLSSAAVTTTSTSTPTTKATAVVDMTTVEQISSDTTTVSMLETAKQDASLNNVVEIQQQQQQQTQNKTNNVIYEGTNSSLSASHNELENVVVEKENNQNENIDFNTKTTTVVPITTFRPTILAITSTTSIPATFEQEVDQNGNEIQTNLTNTEQQSIIKTDLNYNHSTKAIETHLTERVFETTTLEAIKTTTTTTATTTTTELTASTKEKTLTSSLENESTTTTSSSKDELINETTEINFDLLESTRTTIQTTPKQVDEHKHRGYEETTTGSSVSEYEKLERGNKTTTITTTTSTETSVVIGTEGGKVLVESTTPTTTITTEENKSATTTTTAKQESDNKENILSEEDEQNETTTTTTKTMNNTQQISAAATTTSTTTTTSMPATAVVEEETYISLLDDTTTTTQTYSSVTYSTPAASTDAPTKTTTTTLLPPLSSSELPSAVTTKVEEINNVIISTTTELIQTTTQQLLTEITKESSSDPSSTTTSTTYFTEMLPPTTTTHSSQMLVPADIGKSLPTLTSIMGGNSGNMYPKNSEASGETDINVIIAITVSIIGVIALILLVGFLYLMRKRQKQTSYSQRCRPVSLDEYTIDNASVGGSMRKSSALRASKRTYGNLAFDDPSLRPNPMGVHELAKFVQEKLRIFEEFRDVPQITSRLDEVPTGCEDKNRYANVLPLPETRVILQRLNDDEKSEYINANYVTGPKDPPNYYIACQAPLESTVEDFWRMIWEQQSRVIIQATDLIENGVEKCAEYLPPSVTLDNHSSFGDYHITLQNREVKEKYAISTILLKHVGENSTRELTHYWYKWPEVGVPTEETPIIAMLLEARSSLISYAIEQANEDKEKSSMATLKAAEEGTVSLHDSTTSPAKTSNGSSANGSTNEINGNISMVHLKKAARNQGPLTIHCSPGTGRTGTIIACDIAIRSLETPKRTVDIPQIVYYVRRGRASAVLTKEQYEFIYKVANMYAAKITNPTNYN